MADTMPALEAPRRRRRASPGAAGPALSIVYRPLAELIPNARNSRTHSAEQVAKIAAAIKQFGWTNPVLIDEAGVIIAGHARVLAAKRVNFDPVPCIVLAHLSAEQKEALLISDNQLQIVGSGWDADLLRASIGTLNGAGFNLDILGFRSEEIGNILQITGDDGQGRKRRWVWQDITNLPTGEHVMLYWQTGERGTGGIECATVLRKGEVWEYWTHGGPQQGTQYYPPNGERPTLWRRIHYPSARDAG